MAFNVGGLALAQRLGAFQHLSREDAEHLAALGRRAMRRHPAGYMMVRKTGTRHYLMEGWAAWIRELRDGRRALVHIVLPGEPLFGFAADLSAIFLTNAATLDLHDDSILDPGTSSAIGTAMQRATRQREHFLVQHVVRLGRMDAAERVANLFCELRHRADQAGFLTNGRFPLPMTQENVGNLLGLSTVHVNRTYKLLWKEGLARVERRMVDVLDAGRLADRGSYLEPPAQAHAGAIAGHA